MSAAVFVLGLFTGSMLWLVLAVDLGFVIPLVLGASVTLDWIVNGRKS